MCHLFKNNSRPLLAIVDETRDFIFEQIGHYMAICSKIKTRVLPTFSGRKMFDIELNTQFSPKHFGETRVLIFEQMTRNI